MSIHVFEGESVCVNCKHYYQHYISNSYHGGYIAINCGHCTYPRCKNRKPGEAACIHFEMRKR